MFRPEIKVIDCSIRDGGLMNNSKFPLDMVKKVFKAIDDSGVDIVELGYRNSKEHFSTTEYGPWRFCDDDIMKKVAEEYTQSIPEKIKMFEELVDKVVKDPNDQNLQYPELSCGYFHSESPI